MNKSRGENQRDSNERELAATPMMLDPFQQILGVNEAADSAALLGLSGSAAQEPVRIEAALRERLLRVYQHPEARGEEAERVRAALRGAAQQLKQAAQQQRRGPEGSPADLTATAGTATPRPRAAPVFDLTPFDRMVLAVLVASGGWNNRSRAQLVALASAWGVTVQGLMRIVRGLSQHAQSGAVRLGVAEITGGHSLAPYTPAVPTTAAVATSPALLDRLTENLSAELKRDDPWPTIKLSLIFGVLTLAASIIGVRIVFTSAAPDPASTAQVDASGVPSPAPPIRPAPAPPPESKTDAATRRATFPQNPTFLGNSLPPEALAAAAEFAALPAHLDDLIRKLAVEDIPSEAVYRNWDISISTVATGWLLGDASTRQQIDGKLFEALRSAGDRPTVSDRLLNALAPPKTVNEPVTIWRGAWQMGTLARISDGSAQAALPPVVVERARVMLQQSLTGPPPEDRSFEAAASLWLEAVVPQLIAGVEVDVNAYDYWELWLAAQRGLGRGDRHDAAILHALQLVLATATDLGRPGPSVNVAARLLAISLESTSDSVKQRLLGLFDVSEITSRDLWVLTSLLAASDAARWFPDRLIVPEDADQRHRWRIRDELAMVWPAARPAGTGVPTAPGRALVLDTKVAARWEATLSAMLSQPAGGASPAANMRQLILASRLIEAAESLAAQDPLSAERVLDDVQAALQDESRPITTSPAPAAPSRARIGTPSGVDGEWARTYQDAGRQAEARIQQLQALRSAGGDLGPIDAELFVREVYRGSPQEVRNEAHLIIMQFSSGPNVALAMLNQFGEAPANEIISRVVGDFTNQVLPGVRGSGAGSWMVAARLALLNHALSLHVAAIDEIDAHADLLIQSCATRLGLLRRDSRLAMSAATPQDAIRILAQAWLDRAENAVVASPVPASWAGMQRHRTTRLRLAEGPIQHFVAQQLSLLDACTYLLVAEQPAKRAAATSLLAESVKARDEVSTILEQAVQVERVIARMWKLRLMPDAAAAPPQPSTGIAGVPPADPVAASRSQSPPVPPAASSKPGPSTLAARLEALHPSSPHAYFELAEEVADAAADAPSRLLARHLFALAGALDPERFGRSACLALADLETDARAKRRLRALASLLGSGPIAMSASGDQSAGGTGGLMADANLSAAISLGEAFGHYRRGQGAKALEALRKPGATELLHQIDRLLPGGAARVLDDCKHYRGQSRPSISADHLVRMLRLEIALLSGGERSWSSDLLLNGGPPLIEVDPNRLPETLGVDATRPLYRNGRWVESQGTGGKS